MHPKDEALEKFKIYKNEVELKQDLHVKWLRIDIGGEYYDQSYSQSNGIFHETTARYAPKIKRCCEKDE